MNRFFSKRFLLPLHPIYKIYFAILWHIPKNSIKKIDIINDLKKILFFCSRTKLKNKSKNGKSKVSLGNKRRNSRSR